MVELDPQFIGVIRRQRFKHSHQSEQLYRTGVHDQRSPRAFPKQGALGEHVNALWSDFYVGDVFKIKDLIQAGLEPLILPETLLMLQEISIREHTPRVTEDHAERSIN
jgi:hypothetical protein